MLYKFQINDIARIRDNYSSHPLFISIETACTFYQRKFPVINLTVEEVFIQSITIFDNIKQHQADSTSIKESYLKIVNDFRSIYSQAGSEEINIAATLIVTIVFVALHTSNFYIYHGLAEQILSTVHKYNKEATVIIEEIVDYVNVNTLQSWFDTYMQKDTFLSDDLKLLYNINNTDFTNTHLFKYYFRDPSEYTISNFEKALAIAAPTGTKTILELFEKYHHCIDFSYASNHDVWTELKEHYGFTRTYWALNNMMNKYRDKHSNKPN